MTLVKSPRALWLILGLSASLNASVLDEIEKDAPYFFSDLFDHELYNMDHVNEYDEDENKRFPEGEKRKQDIKDKESTEIQIKRLKKRKQNSVKKYYFPKIKDYTVEISKFDPQTIIPGLLKSGISGLTASAAVKYIGANLGTTAVGGGAFLSSALMLGVDTYFDPTVAGELKKAELLCKRLIYEIKNEAINDLEKKYIEARERLTLEQRKTIEDVLLCERKPHTHERQRDLKAFVASVIDLPQNALIVPPTFEKAKNSKYSDLDVEDAFVAKRDTFLNELFPSLFTSTGVTAPSTDKKPILDADFYARTLRERFKEIIGHICDYSYKSLSGQAYPVLQKCIILQGKPGVGKSQAAKLIAESCGLPYQHMTIQGELDLEKIWGSPRGSFSDGQKGAIVSGFLKKNNGREETAKNAVLIFDDIDRSQVDDVLSFLIDLLDKQLFISSYFDFEIDMKDILVILTINTDWFNDKTYKPLKSRSHYVVFPDVEHSQLKEILKKTLFDQDFRLSTLYRGESQQWDAIRNDIADFIIDSHDIDDNRQRILRAKTLLRYARAEWDRIAQDQGW